MTDRRNALKGAMLGSVTLLAAPSEWSKPIINAVMLPAHAQTSCSMMSVEQIDESISITVEDSQVSGPIIAPRTDNAFNDTQNTTLGGCRPGSSLSVRVEFSGTIDEASNSISGDINILQTCGGAFVCEQISTFSATKLGTSAGVNGTYSGMLTGTLQCCDDFLSP